MWLLSGDNNREGDVNTAWSEGRAAFNPAPCYSALAGLWFPRDPEVPNALSILFKIRLRGRKPSVVLGLALPARLKEHSPSPEHVLLPVEGLENQGTEQDGIHHPQTAARTSQDVPVPHKGCSRGQEFHELMEKEGLGGKKE